MEMPSMEEMMTTLAPAPAAPSDKMASGMEVHTGILLDILEAVTRIEVKLDGAGHDYFDTETIYDDVFGDDRNSLAYIGGGGSGGGSTTGTTDVLKVQTFT